MGDQQEHQLSNMYGRRCRPNTANTEVWDGTSWTEVNNLNRTDTYGNGELVHQQMVYVLLVILQEHRMNIGTELHGQRLLI